MLHCGSKGIGYLYSGNGKWPLNRGSIGRLIRVHHKLAYIGCGIKSFFMEINTCGVGVCDNCCT